MKVIDTLLIAFLIIVCLRGCTEKLSGLESLGRLTKDCAVEFQKGYNYK